MCRKLPENLEYYQSLQKKYKYYPESNFGYTLLVFGVIGFVAWMLI